MRDCDASPTLISSKAAPILEAGARQSRVAGGVNVTSRALHSQSFASGVSGAAGSCSIVLALSSSRNLML
jgi:hypothetical protein